MKIYCNRMKSDPLVSVCLSGGGVSYVFMMIGNFLLPVLNTKTDKSADESFFPSFLVES